MDFELLILVKCSVLLSLLCMLCRLQVDCECKHLSRSLITFVNNLLSIGGLLATLMFNNWGN